ncbi:NAD(P)/FAD-dependent oxidoreductase [Paraburkholderia fungorum]|uniref:NAD(P)/FAD-dependent oxidoreductase n=1 Tax=Paraburkholderia fungorum TaxID=134537 RepID=UPI0038B9C37E
MSVLHADVLILGAGPAGATAALNLAPHHSVLMVDRTAAPAQHIGESLPPAARRLLTDMGLWDDFLLQGHIRCHGIRSVWGGSAPAERDFLRDPDGPGWHLDRACFESWLRNKAAERGAALLTCSTLASVASFNGGWEVTLLTPAGLCQLHASALIDAGGRSAMLSRRLGARRSREGKLICGWLYGRDQERAGDGLAHIEAAKHGWWYSAPLPGQRRVLAFHTDSDLPIAHAMRSTNWLIDTARRLPVLGQQLESVGFFTNTDMKFAAAHSAVSSPPAGPDWFAIGDAAVSFDPLSSQGLFNALYTGLAGSEACDRNLEGDANAYNGYVGELDRITDTYRRHLDSWYKENTCWPDSTFWQRRMG